MKVSFSSSVFKQFPGQGFGWERNKSEAGVSRRRMWAELGWRESDPPLPETAATQVCADPTTERGMDGMWSRLPVAHEL